MGMALLNHKEKLLNLEKTEKKSNLNSFYFFLVFIVMYISTFYIFNLSPSTLMRTTKFWFIMSNTLILIIAADSGAFSPSKTLEDCTNINLPPTPLPCNFPTKHVPKTTSTHHHQAPQEDSFDQPPEKIIEVVVVAASDDDHIVLTQETLEIEKQTGGKDDDDGDEKKSEIEEEVVDMLSETESEREEDEYSRMSDEEVNERVEEFIRRFRLQAVTSRRPLP
ncbi:hypothetical protein SASPL_124181 [Salvia splendens]|uniref:Uncharacterized protein n=1 Tax=Salvia splendens TaxID=180675 RepID=A0A8X8ZTX1_SALSN|nr:uncharacterized protein LOC121746089 [Salvia splendens]KAG6416743.1 hypothetical protein SASPL_124181 [Salvia splendens]